MKHALSLLLFLLSTVAVATDYDTTTLYFTAQQLRNEAAKGMARVGIFSVGGSGNNFITGTKPVSVVSESRLLSDARPPSDAEILQVIPTDGGYLLRLESAKEEESYLSCPADGDFSLSTKSAANVWQIVGPSEQGYGTVSNFSGIFSDIPAKLNDYMVRFISHGQYMNGQSQGAIGGLRSGTGAWSFNYVYNGNYKTTDNGQQTTDGDGKDDGNDDGKDDGNDDTPTDTIVPAPQHCLYVCLADGSVRAIPTDYITRQIESDGTLLLELSGNETLTLSSVISSSTEMPEDCPSFLSYKFNNKFNPQVFTDAEAELPSADTINISVGCIGKWLTPSFQLPDEDITVSINGHRQISKVSRLRFDKPVTYRLSHPDWLLLQRTGSTYSFVPFYREQTVTVDFLSDHATGTYGIPTIYITTATGAPPASKTEYIEGTARFDGAGIFPDLDAQPILIRGRGNTTWGGSSPSAKNPYHLKFVEKQKPFGLTNGKHWVLLANPLTGSMTTNAVAMTIAGLTHAAKANHIVPCDLYINGEYRGAYNFTEKVRMANNSVDVADETTATLLELDVNYDAAYRFHSSLLSMPANIKAPEFDDPECVTSLSKDIIQQAFDRMEEEALYGTPSTVVDPQYAASYYFTNELAMNCELAHPKSVYVYCEDVLNLNTSPWSWGPVWDVDWAYGYKFTHTNFDYNPAFDFLNDLSTSGNASGRCGQLFGGILKDPAVYAEYVNLWEDFINGGRLQELLDFCDDYYAVIARSLAHNASSDNVTSNHDKTDYIRQTEKCKSWLSQRAEALAQRAGVVPRTQPGPDEDDPTPSPADTEPTDEGRTGDVNADGALNVADAVSLLDRLAPYPYETCLLSRSDINADGTVNASDTEALVSLILDEANNETKRIAALRRQRHLAPANGRFSVPTVFEADPDNETFLTLTLDIEEGRYSGLQFDLAVPAALELFDIDTQPDFGALTRKLVEYTTDGDTTRYYRLLLYADGSHALAPGRHNLNLQFLTGSRDTSVHPVSIFAALLSTDQGEQERLAPLSSLFTFTPDPLEGIGGQLTAGKTSPFGGSEGDPTYDLTGRPVRTSPLGGSEEGHSRGVFLQNSHKILY